MTVHFETDGAVATVTMDRPQGSNAIDGRSPRRCVSTVGLQFENAAVWPDLCLPFETFPNCVCQRAAGRR